MQLKPDIVSQKITVQGSCIYILDTALHMSLKYFPLKYELKNQGKWVGFLALESETFPLMDL